MLNWIKKGRSVAGTVGIENRPEGIAVAHAAGIAEGSHQLLACEFLHCNEQADRAGLLRECVDSLGLKGARCNAVLPFNSYSLQLTEAPNVPAEELREAMRFRIQDLIPMPLEEAVIDAFPLPADTGRDNMAYAVAAHRQQVDDTAALIKDSGLKLNAIDITELALRNLAGLFNGPTGNIALVLIEPGHACLNMVGGDSLYLTRQFDIQWNGGLTEDLPTDALTLELQRSLDYFERQMRQPPPQQIYLCGENITADKISSDMRDNLSAPVTVLALEEQLPIPADTDIQSAQRCLGAIGGALRREREAKK